MNTKHLQHVSIFPQPLTCWELFSDEKYASLKDLGPTERASRMGRERSLIKGTEYLLPMISCVINFLL